VALIAGVPQGTTLEDFNATGWQSLKAMLADMSVSRAAAGFTPSETAIFVLSLKPPLFAIGRQQRGNDTDELLSGVLTVNEFVDKLALHTTDSYIHGREQVIIRQQEEMSRGGGAGSIHRWRGFPLLH